ncbi:signal peptide, CUB and EGF-like domain-containing protein 1, partial [Exaiptasia diaphana]|uniref:Tyrosine-protein kinase ephrin type A/B receptor-like domain-containing protein n=1 Tax=Exaiptasia diaphana TaxID=2652724 RepID=A0A913X651_EXADI
MLLSNYIAFFLFFQFPFIFFFFLVQCALGTYFNGGKCTMCTAGTYQDKRGQTTCNKCPSGTSSLQGDFVCRDLCPAGTFSKDGMRPFCTLCPQGQFQDQSGQTKCAVCPQNKFTNTKLGATSCQDVKPPSQGQNGLLEISSVKKPEKWRINVDKD